LRRREQLSALRLAQPFNFSDQVRRNPFEYPLDSINFSVSMVSMDKIKDHRRKPKARVAMAGTIVSAFAIPCLVAGIPIWVLQSALLGLAFIAIAVTSILVALAILILPSVLAKLRR